MPKAVSSQKAFIAPFAAFLLLMPLADIFGAAAKYWVFPLQTVLCGALIIWFWPRYSLKVPEKAGFTVLIAVIVLCIWILPQVMPHAHPRLDGFDPTVFRDRPAIYYTTVAMRFIRLAVVVPVLEEIFWRGFLLRYLIREDFESVPIGAFTWLSFLVVTAGFCLEHSPVDYPAALIAGILFNGVAYRTRSLSSCILAHAVTNLLLGLCIIQTGQWGFW
ncbi:MAG: CAAX prenyl protease-related protein [Chthoniobacteraceae bacterium]